MTKKKKPPAPSGTESKCVRTVKTASQTFKKFQTPKGLVVNSKLEANVAEALDAAEVWYDYESFRLPYVVERVYVPDFILGNGIIIECKGYFLSEDRRKMRLVQKQHPHLDIRFVFQKLDSKGQQSKLTNREWCKKYGFKCAEGTIPQEWLDE